MRRVQFRHVLLATVAAAVLLCVCDVPEDSDRPDDLPGALKWRYKTGYAIYGSPAIAQDGTIYFGSCDGHLYALDPIGMLKWRRYTGGSHFSPTIAEDGTIYVGSHDGLVSALNPNGIFRWGYQTGGNVETSLGCPRFIGHLE